MARQPTNPRSTLIQSADRAGKQAKDTFLFDLNRRLQDQGKILTADDMGGIYDPKRGLFTTIDGKPRPLTWDDIKAFKAAVKDVEHRHNKGTGAFGGILVKNVIDLSAPADRQRANSEIHTCFPVLNRAGTVQFQTNAGPNSDVTRHSVMVQFLSYDNALSGGLPIAEAAKLLPRGKIKFDCDCGRHTFWYRYIASIGNFAVGRLEDGFPRVRNPKLYGIACKHVLKVMSVLAHGPTFMNFAKRMLEHGRKTLGGQRQALTVKEQQEFLANAEKARKRDRTVTTSAEKRAARAKQPASQLRAAAKVKAVNDSLHKTHKAKVEKKKTDARLINEFKRAGWSDKKIAATMAAADQFEE